ncbi:STM4013/SEN3800 family hydrolase [Emticicia aquatilis]|nr:STM4013/SEN3800 family hydrolase [Emticicia aquatilis]
MKQYNMNEVVEQMDILFLTLDTLRFDVADKLFHTDQTPNFKHYFPEGWEKCHAPGSFTFASHQAFFAGFLPTPAYPGRHTRLFAANFAGSETTSSQTLIFETPDIVSGFRQKGFKTVCIGGVGFFNKKTALGNVLPALFEESYWTEKYGVTEKLSTTYQFEKAIEIIHSTQKQPLFLFINVSALHQPNWFYADSPNENKEDTIETHEAALKYVDSQMPLLLSALKLKRDTFCIICSDHGTAYGEDGFFGHRLGHPTVWEVPMATFILKK